MSSESLCVIVHCAKWPNSLLVLYSKRLYFSVNNEESVNFHIAPKWVNSFFWGTIKRPQHCSKCGTVLYFTHASAVLEEKHTGLQIYRVRDGVSVHKLCCTSHISNILHPLWKSVRQRVILSWCWALKQVVPGTDEVTRQGQLLKLTFLFFCNTLIDSSSTSWEVQTRNFTSQNKGVTGLSLPRSAWNYLFSGIHSKTHLKNKLTLR